MTNTNNTKKISPTDAIFHDIDKHFLRLLHITKNETSGQLFINMITSTMLNIPEEDYKKSIAIAGTVKNPKNQPIADAAKESIENLRNIHTKFPEASIYTTFLLEDAIAKLMYSTKDKRLNLS